ncbi:hypothetical protein V865_000783 [Kwoniella europaea PYCC6329]|uniref:Uncharacterized protein n=1 Tax=Kwoniella europaea PYCC6329 TaxID=1423913 RepID=A0AAX4K8C2_9TREE
MASTASNSTVFPLSYLSIEDHYKAVIALGNSTNAELRHPTLSDQEIQTQCSKFESGTQSLLERNRLPEVAKWIETVRSSGSAYATEFSRFSWWAEELQKISDEYEKTALPNWRFTKAFEGRLTDCIESTKKVMPLLREYEASLLSPYSLTEDMIGSVKRSVFETDEKYRRLEEINSNKLLDPTPTPAPPHRLVPTTSSEDKWKEWMDMSNDALTVGNAKLQFVRDNI